MYGSYFRYLRKMAKKNPKDLVTLVPKLQSQLATDFTKKMLVHMPYLTTTHSLVCYLPVPP